MGVGVLVGLGVLADTLGIRMEVESTEVNVGPFRADILCREIGTDEVVLIENQLERTDHTHLGQLITYAAGLSAVKIVWIASRFHEDHRAAMDWLNRVTNESANFFGVEVELWRIGESPWAPQFNLVAKPNDWSKQVRASARAGRSRETTERAQKYSEIWVELVSFMEREGIDLSVGSTGGRTWNDIDVGIPHFRFIVGHALATNNWSIYLFFRMDDAAARLEHLKTGSAELDRAIGESVTWKEKQGALSHGHLERHQPHESASARNQMFEWITRVALAFRDVGGSIMASYEEAPTE